MEKEKMLKEYLEGVKKDLANSIGISIPDTVINSILIKYKGTELDYKDLVVAVNEDVEDFLDEVVEKDEDLSLETVAREEEEKKLEELSKEEDNKEKRDIKIAG